MSCRPITAVIQVNFLVPRFQSKHTHFTIKALFISTLTSDLTKRLVSTHQKRVKSTYFFVCVFLKYICTEWISERYSHQPLWAEIPCPLINCNCGWSRGQKNEQQNNAPRTKKECSYRVSYSPREILRLTDGSTQLNVI